MTATPATLGRTDVSPERGEFLDLAPSYAIVPVALEVVADTLTPVAAYVALVGEGEGFLLESAEGDERFGRYSFVGANVLGTFVRTSAGTATATGALSTPFDGEATLDYLTRTLAALRTPPLGGLPPLHSGLVGYLAYDVVREIERIEAPLDDDLGHPDAALHLIGELLVFDHWRQRLTVLVNVAVGGLAREEVAQRYDAACARIDELVAELSGLPSLAPFHLAPDAGSSVVPAPSNRSSRDYRDAVAVAKEHIVAGDIFQVVLSQRFDYELRVPAISVYRALRVLNPSPYLYLLRLGGWTILGSSPEALVQLRDGRATMRPIAGSRPRGSGERADAMLEAELKEDPKERAEHMMLVDLGRNDLGRVCRYGTIVVEELMTVERFSHVTHLTSQVAGDVADGIGPVDVLRATLPAGTLSGAPKVRAMQIINELEPTRRGVYGGVVGYLDLCGNLDTAIAIRTLVVGPDGHGSVQAGAGIVVDSDPEKEDLECRAKAAALFSALAAAESLHADAPTAP